MDLTGTEAALSLTACDGPGVSQGDDSEPVEQSEE